VVFPRYSVAAENVTMAVLLRFTVTRRIKADSTARREGRATHVAGRRSTAGLMSHVVYAEGDGFVVAGVWRTEADGLRRRRIATPLDELGLTAEATTISSVLSFARP
jgi:hypothetical protein